MRTAVASWRLLIAEWRFSLLLGLALAAFMLLVLPVWQSLVALPLSGSGAIRSISDFTMTSVVVDFLSFAPIYASLAIALVPLHRRILLDEARQFPFRCGPRELSYGTFLVLVEAVPAIPGAVLVSAIYPIIYRIRGLGGAGVLPGVAGEIAAAARRSSAS